MLRPAGPRISSMMPVTRSDGKYCCSRRSVASKVPISAPEADMRETNSSSMFSTTSASTVPSVDIFIVEQLPDLAAILLAERQHQHRCALRAGNLLTRLAVLTLRQVCNDAGDIVGVCGLRDGHSKIGR